MKYLACDLDGTLLREDQTISRENLEAIIWFKKEGNKFVISTGRNVDSIYDLFRDYPEIEYDYIVACNGSIVLDNNKEVILNKYIRNDIAEKIIKDFIDREDVCINFVSDGQHYLIETKSLEHASCLSQDISDMLVRFKDRISINELFSTRRMYSFISIFSLNKDVELAEDIKNLLVKIYGQDLEAFRNQFFVDISPKDCSKGNGLKSILELNDIKEENLYAIGDSFNDVSMFELTKNSFTFHHVEEDLKRIANKHVSTVGECIDNIMS
ncbi:Cof-type HAD-IIB family hydrolase [Clostridium sp. AL.422]|uniref:Cof-type HAD-IIB family hydrolase n=1 Tax=Clostridium TaxID=1485 RepID=UPI00293DB099|nr:MULTISPECIES: Cof-type HAD-IIB family hydrolase [unclassified Clostridium]MDV4151669.1 Cof-type HAD-IIB family hydrolase [Clostridium sp. AL.422]